MARAGDHLVAAPAPPALLSGLRRVTDEDTDGLIALVEAAYDEHPGCVLDLPGVDDDLPAPGTTAARRASPWWVVAGPTPDGHDEQVVATIGAGPVTADGAVELKRLYVDRDRRGRGTATALVDLVEDHAAALGARYVELWSDTRFTQAHRRYAVLGYERTGEDRRLHDPSDTTEWRFVKPLPTSAPDHRVTWDGPHGTERAALTTAADGHVLTAEVADVDGVGAATAAIEVDAAWRTRAARVTTAAGTRVLGADGAGRWWVDGVPAAHLDRALDVDVEVTPLTNTLPIRRLLAADVPPDGPQEVTAAWVRVPGPDVEPLHQSYTRHGDDRWRYTAGSFVADLAVDEAGLVVSYGELWQRT